MWDSRRSVRNGESCELTERSSPSARQCAPDSASVYPALFRVGYALSGMTAECVRRRCRVSTSSGPPRRPYSLGSVALV